jgi:hypothetical protein
VGWGTFADRAPHDGPFEFSKKLGGKRSQGREPLQEELEVRRHPSTPAVVPEREEVSRNTVSLSDPGEDTIRRPI